MNKATLEKRPLERGKELSKSRRHGHGPVVVVHHHEVLHIHALKELVGALQREVVAHRDRVEVRALLQALRADLLLGSQQLLDGWDLVIYRSIQIYRLQYIMYLLSLDISDRDS